MSKRIAFFGMVVQFPAMFETQLELMEDHAALGDQLSFISCDSKEVTHCECNELFTRLNCAMCKKRKQAGFRVLNRPVQEINLRDLIRQAESAAPFRSRIPTQFTNWQELKAFKYNDFDCGEAVLSSFISAVENTQPDPLKYVDYVKRASETSVAIFAAIRFYLEHEKCDRMYLFNSRGANNRAVLRACQQKGVECVVYERGAHVNSYSLTYNTFPHDLHYLKNEVNRLWNEAPDPVQRDLAGNRFFENRQKGVLSFCDANFLKHQIENTLPAQWMESSERIAVFTHTESEYAAVGEYYKNRIYASQTEGLIRLIQSLEALQFEGSLAIRFHPNSHREGKEIVAVLAQHCPSFVILIEPNDQVDTYALLKTADKVISYGSTVGIEATYWGRPSILLGRSAYEDVDGTYNPKSHEELEILLKSKLEPKLKLGALKYGHYMSTFGTDFKYIRCTSPYTCWFKGVRIRAPYAHRLLFKLFRKLGLNKMLRDIEHPKSKKKKGK